MSQSGSDFILWHDNSEAFNFFQSLNSYWLHGFSGITGLDHAAVIAKIALVKKKPKARLELLEDIEAVESGCLLAWRDKAAEDEANRKDGKKLTESERDEIKKRRAWRC